MSVERIHLANLMTTGSKKGIQGRFPFLERKGVFTLETFYKDRIVGNLLTDHPEVHVLLDSGAYSLISNAIKLGMSKLEEEGKIQESDKKQSGSVQRKGDARSIADFSYFDTKEVKDFMERYVEFVNKYKDQLDIYVNIDVIFNPERTWENQKYLESMGIRPMPVYHFGEDIKWLKKYMDEYEYIGIGGLGQDVTKNRFVLHHGDPIFSLLEESKQEFKTHGFAITSLDLMLRYRFFSVDSTTWVKHAAYGAILVPRFKKDRKTPDYSKTPYVISVSNQSRFGDKQRPHFTQDLSPEEVTIIYDYFESKGWTEEKLGEDWEERVRANIVYFEDSSDYIRNTPPRRIKIQKRFF